MNNWIKCSDRLPIPKQEILFFTTNEECYKPIIMGVFILKEDDTQLFQSNSDYQYKNFYMYEVTHWQPLPSLPEKE